MDTKKLRQKILDLAIRGKLVPQDPNDEPASVLLERIRAEKQQLIKEGKIKASKGSKACDTSHYEKIEGPFEIPESWEWCLVDDFAYVATGSTPSKDSFVENGIPYIKMYNLRNQKIDFSFHPQYIKEDVHKGKLKRSRTEVGDLIMNIVGPPLGKLAFIPPSLPESNFNQAAVLLRPLLHKEIINRWLFFYLSEMSEINSISTKGSAGQVNISLTQSQNMRIPMPPLAEQIRICSEIEKLWQYLDCIDTSSVVLGDTIENVKSKILNLAIQGKLVPQDPSDEPAIELLKRINPDFKPCDNSHYGNLPNGWVCAMGKDIIRLLSGRDLPPSKFNAKQRGIPYLIGASNIDNHKIHITRWTDYPEVISSKDDVLISCKGTVGEIVINNIGEIHIARQFMALRTAVIIPEYLSLLMQGKASLLKDSAKGVIPGISREDILNLEIAIPPFAEQHRIVESVGTFMGLVNKILC